MTEHIRRGIAAVVLALLAFAGTKASAQEATSGMPDAAVYRAVLDHVLGSTKDTLSLRDFPGISPTVHYYLGPAGQIPPELASALTLASATGRAASSLPTERPIRVIPASEALAFAQKHRLQVLALSPVVVSPDGSRALVEYFVTCGVLCGHGSLLLLARAEDGSWLVIQEIIQLMS